MLENRKTQARSVVCAALATDCQFMCGGPEDEPATGEYVGLRWGRPIDDDNKEGRPQWLLYNLEYPEEGCVPIGRGPGNIGDLIWVREQHILCPKSVGMHQWSHTPEEARVMYTTGGELWLSGPHGPHYPQFLAASQMPRWASRLTLRITGVRIERLQEVNQEDALANGVEPLLPSGAVDAFRHLWYCTHNRKAHLWMNNPLVWVISFEVIHANVDAVLKEAA